VLLHLSVRINLDCYLLTFEYTGEVLQCWLLLFCCYLYDEENRLLRWW